MGDFFQLPAIGTSLYKAALDYTSIAGQLFRGFTVRQFLTQMRAQGDLQHAQMLSQIRDLTHTVRPINEQLLKCLQVHHTTNAFQTFYSLLYSLSLV